MTKYDTDSYSVTTFNARGAKILKISLGNVGLVKATEWARKKLQEGEAQSFVVERVLINSMDQRESWQTRPSTSGRFVDGKSFGVGYE